jgi:hypothetical protein
MRYHYTCYQNVRVCHAEGWRSENSQSQVKIEEGKVWSAAASLSTARESDCLYNHFSTSFRLLTISSTNFEAFEHFERFLCYQMFPCNF